MAREYALTLLCLFGLFTFIVKEEKMNRRLNRLFLSWLCRGALFSFSPDLGHH